MRVLLSGNITAEPRRVRIAQVEELRHDVHGERQQEAGAHCNGELCVRQMAKEGGHYRCRVRVVSEDGIALLPSPCMDEEEYDRPAVSVSKSRGPTRYEGTHQPHRAEGAARTVKTFFQGDKAFLLAF